MATPIGTLGAVPTLTVGGRVFTDLPNLIILYGKVVTGGRFTTLRRGNDTAGYQVTAGKTFTIGAIWGTAEVASSQAAINLLYGNTDVGLDSASAPTTPIYLAGDATNVIAAGVALLGAAGTPNASFSSFPGLDFRVPATKYPAFKGSAVGTNLVVYGYET